MSIDFSTIQAKMCDGNLADFKVELGKPNQLYPYKAPTPPRPPINEPVSGPVAYADMLAHPDTVYGCISTANVTGPERYRYHAGKWQVKHSLTSPFINGSNYFEIYGSSVTKARFFRVDTSAPLREKTIAPTAVKCEAVAIPTCAGFPEARTTIRSYTENKTKETRPMKFFLNKVETAPQSQQPAAMVKSLGAKPGDVLIQLQLLAFGQPDQLEAVVTLAKSTTRSVHLIASAEASESESLTILVNHIKHTFPNSNILIDLLYKAIESSVAQRYETIIAERVATDLKNRSADLKNLSADLDARQIRLDEVEEALTVRVDDMTKFDDHIASIRKALNELEELVEDEDEDEDQDEDESF